MHETSLIPYFSVPPCSAQPNAATAESWTAVCNSWNQHTERDSPQKVQYAMIFVIEKCLIGTPYPTGPTDTCYLPSSNLLFCGYEVIIA